MLAILPVKQVDKEVVVNHLWRWLGIIHSQKNNSGGKELISLMVRFAINTRQWRIKHNYGLMNETPLCMDMGCLQLLLLLGLE